MSIDHDVLGLLPDDGHLSGLVTMAVESDELEPPAAHQDIPPQDTPLASTFIPMPTTGRTEQQTIRQSVQQHHMLQTMHLATSASSGTNYQCPRSHLLRSLNIVLCCGAPVLSSITVQLVALVHLTLLPL